ncbi:MAG TPA: prepilin-type N-terminal cleavage/methylation domain-containing protein [Candidatus Acidoferrum sp.]|nr:prepilin-type N-terminal cleavage/methylation domain-containing protein [Candidatus Acidoferrum sp.]
MTMKNKRKARPSTQRGFSMIELVVVVGIILLLSAISVPNIMRSMNIYRLNATATSLQNIIEVARFNAVRLNTSISVRQTVVSGQPAFYVDLANGAYVSTDPVFLVPNYVQVTPTGAPAASTTGLPNTNALGSGCIAFNSRGVVDYTTCGGGVQSVWYISLGMIGTNAGYRAITVTPMGQAKVWSATGSGGWSAM